MRINGLMIDCSRLMERHAYYRRLLDFMADWGMNTLLWHFTDDHGVAVELPGFRNLAMPHAFTAREMRSLIRYAADRGIEVIPELETFGHTRYLTDRPEYEHLFAGRKTRRLLFDAIDPLNAESERLMARLMKATARVFSSDSLHVGCDEVELADYCRTKGGLDAAQVWAGYVNRMIEQAKSIGKEPMIWGDHPKNDARIRQLLRKDVTVVDWCYWLKGRPPGVAKFVRAGFERVLVAPSLACYGYRFLPTTTALENTRRMAQRGVRYGCDGLINTIWCPYRYVQGALYYGIAYSATVVSGNGRADRRAFNRVFSKRVFGTDLAAPLGRFLMDWPKLEITSRASAQLVKRRPDWDPANLADLERVADIGRRILPLAERYCPARNADIWDAMLLAGQAAWLCAESVMIRRLRKPSAARRRTYNTFLKSVRKRLGETWDATRFPDSPQKRRTKFRGTEGQYALILIDRLRTVK